MGMIKHAQMRIIFVGIAIVVVIGIIYFIGFENSEKLEITDYEIIANDSNPLFLSVMISENISEIGINNSGYGFAWLSESSGKLNGYTTNTHSDSQWHTESITIDNAKQFCFDDAILIKSNVKVDQNKINVIIEQYDLTNFDRVISFNIIRDDNCHLGFAGKIVDELFIK